jgi:hypothetical protein
VGVDGSALATWVKEVSQILTTIYMYTRSYQTLTPFPVPVAVALSLFMSVMCDPSIPKRTKTISIEEWDALHALIREQNEKIEEQARLIATLMDTVEELKEQIKELKGQK